MELRTKLVLICLLTVFPAGSAAAESRPNIVLILVDDLGRQDLGCEGSKFYETPNIDRLADRSLRFENGYSACQVCSPSRASIQTGKYPTRVGITDYINPAGANQPEQWKRNTKLLPASFSKQLALKEETIAESLKGLGYHTYFAGKWHLGGEGYGPTDQGYDINVGGDEYGSPPGGFFSPYRNRRLKDGPVGEQLPLRLGRETAEYILNHAQQEQPYFAMLSFYSVHAPIQTTEALWNKYRDKAASMGLVQERSRFLLDHKQEVRQVQDNPLYAGMMESLDDAVGLVLEAIERSGEAGRTVIVFTSDNGGVSSGDGYATSCLPMRGGKGRQWEGGIRQPLYFCVPGKRNGETTKCLASGIDLHPTLIELAGGTSNPELDGISLVPELEGKEMPSRKLYWHYPHYGNQGGEPSAILRDGEWKLIYYYEDHRAELYHLGRDLGETSDLSGAEPERTAELLNDLKAWLVEVDALMPSVNPNFNLEAEQAALQRLTNVGIPKREREHFRYLSEQFVPNGGWWQKKKN